MSSLPDNIFRLNISGVSNCNFEVSSYCITNGYKWGGITTSSDAQGIILDVDADRSKSDLVAQWFVHRVGSGAMFSTYSEKDAKPDNLHFAFTGSLDLTLQGRNYRGFDIVIGQGFTMDMRNNWWIGSKNMQAFPTSVKYLVSQFFDLRSQPEMQGLFVFGQDSKMFNISTVDMGYEGDMYKPEGQ